MDISSYKKINQTREKLIEFWFIQTLERIKEFIQGTTCYISYARGIAKYDKQIYKLSTHLKAAGVNVYLDIWNNRAGTKQSRFTERISQSDFVILAGSKQLLQEYGSERNGSLLNLEIDLMVDKLKTKAGSIIPIFLDGSKETSIPAILGTMVCIDFTHNKTYYEQVFQILEILCQGKDLSLFKKEFMIQKEYLCSKECSLEILLQKEKEAKEKDKALTHQIAKNIISNYEVVLNKQHAEREHIYTNQTLIDKTRLIDAVESLFSYIKRPYPILFILAAFSLGIFIFIRSCNFPPSPNPFPDPKSLPPRSDFNIPSENDLLNRRNLLQRIEEKFTEKKDKPTITRISIVGMGGAGKTILARHYARLHKDIIAWELNAETKASLLLSFKELAYALATTKALKEEFEFINKIQDAVEKEKQFITFVKDRLKANPNWLLIYDNVGDAEDFSEIRQYFPQDPLVCGPGKVIITTRDSNISNSGYISPSNVIQIDELTQEEALLLFSKILYNCVPNLLTPDQKAKALTFLKHIPLFPLDISIAGKYLNATGISYERYLDHMRLYDREFEHIQTAIMENSKTRYSIIRISLERMLKINPEFGNLFLFMCLLDSQNIPIDLLKAYKKNIFFDNFIHHLNKYSLITSKCMDSFCGMPSISLHRSTQELSLIILKNALSLKIGSPVIHSISETLNKYLDEVAAKEDKRMKPLTMHAEAFLTHKDLLDELSIANISLQLGRFYYYAGKFNESKEKYEQSLLLYKKKLGEDNIKTAETLVRLGALYKYNGHFLLAKPLLEQGLSIYKKNYNENHFKIAWTLSLLGSTNRSLGNYKEAIQCAEEALNINKQYPGANKRETAMVKLRAANILRDIGKNEDAKNLLEQALAEFKQDHDDKHYLVALTLGSLGAIHIQLGNYKIAEELLTKGFNIDKHIYGEENPDTVFIMRELGVVYKYLRKYKLAKAFLLRSFQIQIKLYGENDFENGYVLAELGDVCFLNHEIEEAKELLNKSLLTFDKNNHPDKYICLELLGDLYLYQSNRALIKKELSLSQRYKAKATAYYQNCFEILKKYMPENSPHLDRVGTKIKKISQKVIEQGIVL
jgi:tetratricopeptide (TPR) repeat protein